MEENNTPDSPKSNTSRRKFLQIGGSFAFGAVIAGTVGSKLWKMVSNPGKLFYGNTNPQHSDEALSASAPQPLAWKLANVFTLQDEINASAILPISQPTNDKPGTQKNNLLVATSHELALWTLTGTQHTLATLTDDVRDIAVAEGNIYLLHPSRISVYTSEGKPITSWEACSDDADYCQLTVTAGRVYVTDAAAKNICIYSLDGTLQRFVNSPHGFVVPSYSFAITHFGQRIFCSNPGRHLVEEYTLDGDFIKSYGKTGSKQGEFCGCCNPVYIAFSSSGELLTSEKGIPRISCYDADGSFRTILLDSQALGGGHEAYDFHLTSGLIVVTKGKNVSIFKYDESLASHTLCGQCTVDCPLKVLA